MAFYGRGTACTNALYREQQNFLTPAFLLFPFPLSSLPPLSFSPLSAPHPSPSNGFLVFL